MSAVTFLPLVSPSTYLSHHRSPPNPTPHAYRRAFAQYRTASLNNSRYFDSDVIPKRNGLVNTPFAQHDPPLGTHVAYPRALVDYAPPTNVYCAAHGVEAGARMDYRLGGDGDGIRACQDGGVGYCEG